MPEYSFWLKLILGSVLALTFILGLVFLSIDTKAALVMFGITNFGALLFKAILPRRFQIFEDRLKILFGESFAINIPLVYIAESKSVSSSNAFAYSGLRFATSTRRVIEIVRKKGMNLVISPRNNEMFLEQLNQAWQSQSG